MIEIDIKEAHCPDCGKLVPNHYLIVKPKYRVINISTSWEPPVHIREYKQRLRIAETYLIEVPELGNCMYVYCPDEGNDYLVYINTTITKVEYQYSELYVTAEGIYITACWDDDGLLHLVDQTGKNVPYTKLTLTAPGIYENVGVKLHLADDNSVICEMSSRIIEYGDI